MLPVSLGFQHPYSQRVGLPQLAHEVIDDAVRRAAGEQVGQCAVARRRALERGGVDGTGGRFRAQNDR